MLEINGTKTTPEIIFDDVNGVLNITGRSLQEDPSCDFYNTLIEHINEYEQNPNKITVVNIKIEYFNSSSVKYFLYIFKILERIHEKTMGVIVNWYYEEDDEDILEHGENYSDILKIPFNLIEMQNIFTHTK